MLLPWTLTRYFATRFLAAVLVALGGFVCLIFFGDLLEMLRRFGDKEGVGFGTILSMTLLKMPNLAEETIPFAVLFGAGWAFAQLSRSSELVVARAAGVSVWQFLGPSLALGLLTGAVVITVYNPVAAAMVSRFESLEAKYSRNKASLLDVSQSGLWLRQLDDRGPSIFNALRVSEQGRVLDDVQIFLFEGQDKFVGEITAKRALLMPGRWELEGGEVRWVGRENVAEPITAYPTQLTQSQIQDSFASPKTMSFWQLPRFIRLAEKAGFSATRHRLHWYSMLALPILLCAMILLAATFALPIRRGRGIGLLILAALLSGFALYFATKLSNALGVSGIVPVTLAAWAPAAVATLLGVAVLLHLEDG